MKQQERLMKIIEATAVAGDRMPMHDELQMAGVGSPCVAFRVLTEQGLVRREIGHLNYRVVEILTGPHAGKRTAQPPGPWKPYRIIDSDGDYRPGGWTPRHKLDAEIARKRREAGRPADKRAPMPNTVSHNGVTLPKLKCLDGGQ